MNKYLITYIDMNEEKVTHIVRATDLDSAQAYFNSKTPFISLATVDMGEDKDDGVTPVIGPP